MFQDLKSVRKEVLKRAVQISKKHEDSGEIKDLPGIYIFMNKFFRTRLLQVFFLLTFLLVANPAFSIPKTILIFTGEGTAMTDGMVALFKLSYPDAEIILAADKGIFSRALSFASARSSDLSDFVIVIPGGQMNVIASVLGFYGVGPTVGEVKKQILSAVMDAGATYFGVCAGAGLGCEEWLRVTERKPFLGFTEGACCEEGFNDFGFPLKAGESEREFFHKDQGRIVEIHDQLTGLRLPIFWYLGPSFPSSLRRKMTEARFVFEANSAYRSSSHPLKTGLTAVSKYRYGRGLVVLSLVHPEQPFCERSPSEWGEHASEMCRQLEAMTQVERIHYKRGKVRFLTVILRRSGEDGIPNVPGFLITDVRHDGDCGFHATESGAKKNISRRLFVEKLRAIIASGNYPPGLQTAMTLAAVGVGTIDQWIDAIEDGIWLAPADFVVLAIVEEIHIVLHSQSSVIGNFNQGAGPAVHVLYDAAHYFAMEAIPLAMPPAAAIAEPILMEPQSMSAPSAVLEDWSLLRPLFSDL